MKESCKNKKVKCYKCGQIRHLLFVCSKGEKEGKEGRENAREKEGGKQGHMAYYCWEQDEERWEVLKAIVNTGCEAIIIGDL